MIELPIQVAQVAIELSKLLSVKFSPGHLGYDLPIRRSLDMVMECSRDGDFHARDAELNKLQFLAKHLREIDEHDPALRRSFAETLVKSKSDSDFAGTRFEVNIAASLIKKSVPFEKSERPDFRLTYNGSPAFIECGSAHMANRLKRHRRKLAEVINAKAKKTYACPETALFVDITNVAYARPVIEDIRLREFLTPLIDKTRYGAVLLFQYLRIPSINTYHSVYIRVDSKVACSAPLRQFLDAHFPLGLFEISDHVKPCEG